MLCPAIQPRVEEPLTGLCEGIDPFGEVISAEIAAPTSQGQIIEIITPSQRSRLDVIDVKAVSAQVFGGVTVLAEGAGALLSPSSGFIGHHEAWALS